MNGGWRDGEAGPLVLAIDVGSTWCKVAYVDPAGRAVAEGRAYCRGGPAFAPGAAALAEVRGSVGAAVAEANALLAGHGGRPAPAAVGLSCRGVIGVVLDTDGEPVGVEPAPGRRAADADTAAAFAAPEWGTATAYGYSYAVSLVGRCWWLRREHPSAWARVRRAGALHDELLRWLTGRWLTDPSTGPGNLDWGPPSRLAGLPPDAFPPIRPWEAVAGPLTGAAAAALGLPAGTPVVVGAHDGAAANLGAGAHAAGDACVTLGSNLVLRAVTGERVPGCFGYLVAPGRWAWVRGAHGVAEQVDAVVAVLDDGPAEVTPARHAALTRLAAGVPAGADGLRLPMLPPGSEREQAAAARRAADAGHPPGRVYRAALEGMALAVRGLLERARADGCAPRRFVVTGGAAANRLLLAILSGVLGTPVEAAEDEAGRQGVAIHAAVGAGWYPSIDAAARAMVSQPTIIEATPAETAAYAALVGETALPGGAAPEGRGGQRSGQRILGTD